MSVIKIILFTLFVKVRSYSELFPNDTSEDAVPVGHNGL